MLRITIDEKAGIYPELDPITRYKRIGEDIGRALHKVAHDGLLWAIVRDYCGIEVGHIEEKPEED